VGAAGVGGAPVERLTYPTDGGAEVATGIAPNERTHVEDRDPFVGTPWHKHVPARIERV